MTPVLTKLYSNLKYTKKSNDLIHIELFIIDKCNVRCQYCYNVFPRHNDIINADRCTQFVNFIYTKFKPSSIQVDIIGGEPTLHPNLIKIVQDLIKYIPTISIGIFTNFSADISLYSNILSLSDKIELVISWHSVVYTPEIFITKIKQFSAETLNSQFNIRILFEPTNLDSAVTIFQTLIDYGVATPYLTPLINNQNFNNGYNETDYSIYDKLNNMIKFDKIYVAEYSDGTKFEFSHYDVMRHKIYSNCHLWLCDAGIRNLYVHANGDVYPCCTLYNNKTYFRGNINLDFKLIKFSKTLCRETQLCLSDYEITKVNVFKK